MPRNTPQYSAEDRKVLKVFKDEYRRKVDSHQRNEMLRSKIFPTMFNHWGTPPELLTEEEKARRLKDLKKWIINNWRPYGNTKELKRARKLTYIDMLCRTRPTEVEAEARSILRKKGQEETPTNIAHKRTTAASQIYKTLNENEKQELAAMVEQHAALGNPTDLRESKADKGAWKSVQNWSRNAWLDMGVVSVTFFAYMKPNKKLAIDICDDMSKHVNTPQSFVKRHAREVEDFKKLFVDYVKAIYPRQSTAGTNNQPPAASDSQPIVASGNHPIARSDNEPTAASGNYPISGSGNYPIAAKGVASDAASGNRAAADDDRHPLAAVEVYPSLSGIDISSMQKKELVSLMRTYLRKHYLLATGGKYRRIPYKRLEDDPSLFLRPIYTVPTVTLKDPQNMQIEDIRKFLSHVHEREKMVGAAQAFRFDKYWHKSRVRDAAYAAEPKVADPFLTLVCNGATVKSPALMDSTVISTTLATDTTLPNSLQQKRDSQPSAGGNHTAQWKQCMTELDAVDDNLPVKGKDRGGTKAQATISRSRRDQSTIPQLHAASADPYQGTTTHADPFINQASMSALSMLGVPTSIPVNGPNDGEPIYYMPQSTSHLSFAGNIDPALLDSGSSQGHRSTNH